MDSRFRGNDKLSYVVVIKELTISFGLTTVSLNYEKQYGLEEYIDFLEKNDTREREIARHLNYLEETRKYIDVK